MIEALLSIMIPESWVTDILKKYSAKIEFIECMPFGKKGGRGLVEMGGDKTTMESIIKEIKMHPAVCRAEISFRNDGKASGYIITNKCVACEALSRSECFLRSATSIGNGKVLWRVVSGKKKSLASLVRDLKSVGCQVEIKSVTKVEGTSMLTRRQEEVLRLAFEKGYYDCPKKTTIRDLAKELDISPSALGEILQRGEKAILEEYFRKKR
ncbi:MAG: helix-turn-helix domain-containing protein [Methanomassiliicoccales archaeon]|jgi:predicted DNA binding protein|nr:helix-turn-helix domain-containing protein [Methanomassiliicoccales archaeon]